MLSSIPSIISQTFCLAFVHVAWSKTEEHRRTHTHTDRDTSDLHPLQLRMHIASFIVRGELNPRIRPCPRRRVKRLVRTRTYVFSYVHTYSYKKRQIRVHTHMHGSTGLEKAPSCKPDLAVHKGTYIYMYVCMYALCMYVHTYIQTNFRMYRCSS